MNKITVTTNKKASMSDFYGIFFEDINHAADGGLYGEMIRNRAFEFSPMDNPSYQALTAWKRIEEGGASVSSFVSNKSPFSKRNPNYLILEINKAGTRAGIKNLGYNSGIAVKENESYNFSCYAKSDKPCEITVSIDNAYGEVITEKSLNITSNEWTEYSFTLTSPVDDFSAVLAVTSKQECKFCLDFVSLFPVKTYKNRKNGMRNDIAEMLADLKPKFMRFPGGCLIHDGTLNSDDRNSMYRWKNTIGAVTDRPSRRKQLAIQSIVTDSDILNTSNSARTLVQSLCLYFLPDTIRIWSKQFRLTKFRNGLTTHLTLSNLPTALPTRSGAK